MPDWGALFELTVDPVELFVRGTLMYWLLFMLLRFVLRRDIGSIGVADVLLLVLIADAAQNAMSGGYESLTDGVILVGTIAGWNWLLDVATYRIPALRKVLEAKPLPLVRHGKLMRRNLRKELITHDELMAKLREYGIEKLEEVKVATMESDGEISVLKEKPDAEPQPRPASGKDLPAA
jgi:uncharacterized membrane protein YcaP (DUF421 family)